jgi:hypothetical protein
VTRVLGALADMDVRPADGVGLLVDDGVGEGEGGCFAGRQRHPDVGDRIQDWVEGLEERVEVSLAWAGLVVVGVAGEVGGFGGEVFGCHGEVAGGDGERWRMLLYCNWA